MPEKRRWFDREFREGAVGIVGETNKPIAQVAADLGINPGTLGTWVNQDKIDRGEVERLGSDERAELAWLRAENAELRRERGCAQALGGWVGEGGDAVSLAAFIADQPTSHRVPYTVACRALGVSASWFYKWRHRSRVPSPVQQRRAERDAAVVEAFAAARGLHGSPRVLIDLRAVGWVVSEKTVAKSMTRQGLVARTKKRRKNLT
ncbi:MAG TPA: transposase [Pseudonocardiaceae bacterium]|nr:transposase [Pseudonocardiaceae bacterium]